MPTSLKAASRYREHFWLRKLHWILKDEEQAFLRHLQARSYPLVAMDDLYDESASLLDCFVVFFWRG